MATKKGKGKSAANGSDKDVAPPEDPIPSGGAAAKKDPLGAFFAGLMSDGADAREKRTAAAREALAAVIAQHEVAENYNILLLYDEGSLIRGDADNIYRALRAYGTPQDILLVIHSRGGDVASAYLISQLCREHSKDKFLAAVPRQAKSAATLLACGADEIHLGSMSELGPIDPQIGGQPALGLGNALQHIADLVEERPGASSMFAEYLASTVAPIDLGYYERVAESAAQYAERLLRSHEDSLGQTPAEIASKLVYSYKDHGFVIDKNEAVEIFGEKTIVMDSPEYQLANDLYDRLSLLRWMAEYQGYRFYWVGSPESDCSIWRPPE